MNLLPVMQEILETMSWSKLIMWETNFKGSKLTTPTPTYIIKGGEITQIFHGVAITIWLRLISPTIIIWKKIKDL